MIEASMRAVVEELMKHPTALCEVFAGVKKVTGEYEDGTADFEPDGSKTVVIRVNGGANNVRIDRVKIEGEE